MVFFEDVAFYGRMNRVRKCWVHRPNRAIVKRQAMREHLYAFSTVYHQTGKLVQLFPHFAI